MKQSNLSLILAALAFALITGAAAQEQQQEDRLGRYISVVWENDTFLGSDDGYTNGMIMSYSNGWWPDPAENEYERWILTVGHVMMTPEDIEPTELLKDDRPYAGLFFAKLNWGHRWENGQSSTGVLLGTVGPSSQADHVQHKVHELVDASEPNGWEHQLDDELVLNVDYEYRRVLLSPGGGSGWTYDLTAYGGGALGTLFTAGKAGVVGRIGLNPPGPVGSSLYRGGLSSVPQVDTNAGVDTSLYLILGAEAHLVLHNIFLDGTVFRDSHSVDRIPLQAAGFAGFGWRWDQFQLTFIVLRATRQFEEQSYPTRFTSMTFSWLF